MKILPSGTLEDGALRGFSITERVERPDGGDACLLGEEENFLAANSCFDKVKVIWKSLGEVVNKSLIVMIF